MKITDRDKTYNKLKQIAIREFSDIVERTMQIDGKLRILLIDGSFIDIWLSVKRTGTYAYHWERRNVDGKVYRYNNLPDKKAKSLQTYPKHFHNGGENKVLESDLSDEPEEAIRTVLEYAKSIMNKRQPE